MTDVWFIVAAYAATGGALVAYAGWTLRRGRRLSEQVPADRRRWL